MIERLVLLLLAALALAGCSGNSTDGMNVPTVVLAPPGASVSATPFGNREDSQPSFRLDRVIVDLPRGSVVAHFPNRFWKKWQYLHLCNLDLGSDASVQWGAGTEYFGNWSTAAGKIFFDVMRRRGTNVVGDPSALFRRKEAVQSAELLVGGRIVDIRGNICHRHEPITSAPLHQYLGEFYVKVEWEVFFTLNRRVVYTFASEGYAESRKPVRDGVADILFDAFAAAVENASVDYGFREVLTRDDRNQTAAASFDALTVKGRARYSEPLRDRLADITGATVTIELGTGHGSGFLISRDGYLLTNAHVVGDGKRVPVVFSNGARVSGTVLRVARSRDVALVRIPIAASSVLPIRRNEPLAVADDVYVVGTPFDPSLSSTVTKGIVSAFRKSRGQLYIQSDAAITGGNSGGPLVDAKGNVVGITVAKFTQGENLNLFIPIDEALTALNLSLVVE